MIYLDNNATTFMSESTIREMVNWCNVGNPSSGYASARAARKMMTDFRVYLGKLCSFDACCAEPRDTLDKSGILAAQADDSKYKVIFTSGASESNAMAVESIISAYREHHGPPHVIISAIEHKSILLLVESYEARGLVAATYVKPDISGHILPEDVSSAIRPNTCLISVMHANNETGAINDITTIGKIAHAHAIPFHCDTVQTFGKYRINPLASNIDSFSVSFHKLHGPPGIGALIIKQKLINGYKIKPIIFGTQNEGLRGGTENLPGIGGAFLATKMTMFGRENKNWQLIQLKSQFITELSKRIKVSTYIEYTDLQRHNKFHEATPGPIPEIVLLSGLNPGYLPNTVLFSVVADTFCNTKLKDFLERRGIIVSVGSACNTSSDKASHVLYAMGADKYIRQGTIRISFGDHNTSDEIGAVVDAIIDGILDQKNNSQISPGNKDTTIGMLERGPIQSVRNWFNFF